MKRKIYNQLIEWKNNKINKPLLILGVRQCGKTYIINEFCQNEYKNYLKINLLERNDVVNLYKENINSEEKYKRLKAMINFDFDKENSILFIDEIQESEELIKNYSSPYTTSSSGCILILSLLIGIGSSLCCLIAVLLL